MIHDNLSVTYSFLELLAALESQTSTGQAAAAAPTMTTFTSGGQGHDTGFDSAGSSLLLGAGGAAVGPGGGAGSWAVRHSSEEEDDGNISPHQVSLTSQFSLMPVDDGGGHGGRDDDSAVVADQDMTEEDTADDHHRGNKAPRYGYLDNSLVARPVSGAYSIGRGFDPQPYH